MTYIHPDVAKALKRYAVENNCKVHDLCVEAFKDWFQHMDYGNKCGPIRANGSEHPKTLAPNP